MKARRTPTRRWTMAALALVASSFVQLDGGALRRQARNIALPPWSGAGACELQTRNSSSRIVAASGSIAIPCDDATARVQCNFSNAEPIDTSTQTPCGQGRLSVVRGRTIEIDVGENNPPAVEWLQRDAVGLHIVATRRLAVLKSSVVVSMDPGRFLRFSRDGFSPLTLWPSSLGGETIWHLPAPVRGGELLVLQPLSPIAPVSYQLTSRTGQVSDNRAGQAALSLTGLSVGTYDVVPIFEGGIHGQSQSINIEESKSTVTEVRTDDLGGISLEFGPTACAQATGVRIATVASSETKNSSGTARATVTHNVAVLEHNSCRRSIAGLPAGEYQVTTLGGPNSTSASSHVPVRPGVLSPLLLELGRIHVSGKVMLNGRPFRQGLLDFLQEGSSRPAGRAQTDETGRYDVNLDSPGSYRVKLRSTRSQLLGQEKSVQLAEGENAFDWFVKGGMLTVRLKGQNTPNGGDLTLTLIQTSPRVVTGTPGLTMRLKADDPAVVAGEIAFDGIGFAEYTVRAVQVSVGSGDHSKASSDQPATITEAKPETAVTLILEDNNGRLVLIDPQGNPVGGAEVHRNGVNPREIEPGTFSLDGVPPNFPLYIRARGYAPTCRTAQPNVVTTVNLDPGRTVEIQFPGLRNSEVDSPWGEIQWAGADCMVALDAFPFAKLAPGPDDMPRFAVSNFPLAAVLVHTFQGLPGQTISAGSVIVIPYRRSDPSATELVAIR